MQQRGREYMDRANHEYYLREQIQAIQDELGDNEDEEIAELRAKLAKSKMNDEARELSLIHISWCRTGGRPRRPGRE